LPVFRLNPSGSEIDGQGDNHMAANNTNKISHCPWALLIIVISLFTTVEADDSVGKFSKMNAFLVMQSHRKLLSP